MNFAPPEMTWYPRPAFPRWRFPYTTIARSGGTFLYRLARRTRIPTITIANTITTITASSTSTISSYPLASHCCDTTRHAQDFHDCVPRDILRARGGIQGPPPFLRDHQD